MVSLPISILPEVCYTKKYRASYTALPDTSKWTRVPSAALLTLLGGWGVRPVFGLGRYCVSRPFPIFQRPPRSCRGAAQISFLTFALKSVRVSKAREEEGCAWAAGAMGMAITAMTTIAAFPHALDGSRDCAARGCRRAAAFCMSAAVPAAAGAILSPRGRGRNFD